MALQSGLVLDYSDYSIFIEEYGMNVTYPRYAKFFEKKGWCPFCLKDATMISNLADSFTYDFGPRREIIERVWQCDCGWWQIDFHSHMEEPSNYKDWYESICSSQLKKFNIGDKAIPIDVLRSYLHENEDKVYNIHDKKMEELVASVFREHFQCEVREVGKSHDGGIDLILIEANSPTIVQVKRRKSPNKTENVKEIRDLLGAMVLSQTKKSIFVTTADHFSPDAINSRNIAINNKSVESFELYDYRRFMDMLQLQATDPSQVWKQHLQFEKSLPPDRK